MTAYECIFTGNSVYSIGRREAGPDINPRPPAGRSRLRVHKDRQLHVLLQAVLQKNKQHGVPERMESLSSIRQVPEAERPTYGYSRFAQLTNIILPTLTSAACLLFPSQVRKDAPLIIAIPMLVWVRRSIWPVWKITVLDDKLACRIPLQTVRQLGIIGRSA